MKIINQSEYAKSLFANKAGCATDSAVAKAIMVSIRDLLPANQAQGRSTDELPLNTSYDKMEGSPLTNTISFLRAQNPPSSIAVVMYGESHTNQQDINRSKMILDAVGKQEITPRLLVFERGMNDVYDVSGYEGGVIREENLTTVNGGNFALINGLSICQRSMIVAGYLALVFGGGNQDEADNALVFFGENHTDILTSYYRYFARHSPASHILARQSSALIFKSNVK